MLARAQGHQLARPVAVRSTRQTAYPEKVVPRRGFQMPALAQAHQLAQPVAVRPTHQTVYPQTAALQQGL
jgi:hypothetical protein